MDRVLKNPRIVKGAASDAHAGAAGFVNHLAGSFSGDDISVADNGNGLDCLHDGADAGEVYDAAKALLAGATWTKIAETPAPSRARANRGQ